MSELTSPKQDLCDNIEAALHHHIQFYDRRGWPANSSMIEKIMPIVSRKIEEHTEHLEQRVAQLEDWKRQQLEIEASWSLQAIAKLLGLPLGTQIHPQIEPGIKDLQQQLTDAKTQRDRARGERDQARLEGGKLLVQLGEIRGKEFKSTRLTRDEAESLVNLLEDCDPKQVGLWRHFLAADIRQTFGMAPREKEAP